MENTNTLYVTILLVNLLTFLEGCKKSDTGVRQFAGTQNLIAAAPAVSESPIESNTISWSQVQGQPTATHEVHGAVVDNKLYIFGGFDVNRRPSAWVPTKRAYVYDPLTNKWASIKSLPHTPSGDNFGGATHMGVATDGTDIYFAGGYIANAAGTGQVFGTKQAWKYIVASNSYIPMPSMPQALAAGKLEYLNGKLHYMGGANLSRQDVAVHYVLDLANLSAGWKSAAPLLDSLNHPGSAVLNGKIYFVGGAHHQDQDTETQSKLQVYNPVADNWQRLADMPIGLDHISSSVVILGERIIVLGGETSHNVLSNKVFAYSTVSNSWTELTPLPSARSAGVAAVLYGNIYYTGGNFSNVTRKGVLVSGLLPIADAYVRGGTFASTNYGTDTLLTVKGAATANFIRKAYLKFSLAGVNSITSAKLRIYGNNADNTSPASLYTYGVADDSWAENTLTFTNAPVNANTALDTVALGTQPAYVELDVTEFVRSQITGDKTASFVIKDADNRNTTLQFSSRESKVNPPMLILQ